MGERETMRVRVEIVVEIDVESYRENYGADSKPQIRNDVKYAILTTISSGGVLADGIVGAELLNP